MPNRVISILQAAIQNDVSENAFKNEKLTNNEQHYNNC